jgi:pimeloyl-ACP methyl ester carboxylesterase
MTRRLLTIIGCGCALFLAQESWGQEKAPAKKGVEGNWEGSLDVAGQKLRLAFHITKAKDGTFSATMDSIDQGAKGIAIKKTTVEDGKLKFDLPNLGAEYEGKIDEEKSEIAGDWKQSGMSFSLTLKRVTKTEKAKRPQEPQKPYPYDEQEVSYENKKAGVKLAGTLTLPRSGAPFPAVLLITGSGPQDRNETIFEHKPFLVLADFLTRRGVAVLRVDDRGVGGSTGNTMQSTTADFVDDVLTGVEYLKGRKEIDPAKIGLIGHSEGGIIAPWAASRSSDVAFIVLLAGTGLPGEEIMYSQARAGLEKGGASEKHLAFERQLQSRLFALVRAEKDNAVVQKKSGEIFDEELAKVDDAARKDLSNAKATLTAQTRALTSPWFRFFLAYDPRPALRKVKCPVLALNGEKDFQVVPKANLPAIEAALREGKNKDFTTKELPKLNHLFQTCTTGLLTEYGTIEETLAPVALEIIGDWIAKHTSEPRPNASSIGGK